MNYIQSKAIRDYWEATEYKPTFDEILTCVLGNKELNLKQQLTVLSKLNKNRKDIRVEKYITLNKYYLNMFEASDDGPFFFYCEGEHFNTLSAALAHAKSENEKDGNANEEYWFDVKKNYLNKECCGLTICYRCKNNKVELMYICPDLEIVENKEEDEYRHLSNYLKPTYRNLPFKTGDIIIDLRGDAEGVLNEVNGSNNSCFFVGSDDLVRETYYIDPYFCDYPTENELEDVDELLKLTSALIKGEMAPGEFISRFEGTKKIMSAFRRTK